MSQIRSVQISDIPQVLEIYAHYLKVSPVSLEREVPSLEVFSERVEGIIEQAPFLVYETQGEIAGYAHGAPSEEPGDSWTFETTVYVSPSHSGKGIGSALYEKLLELLREQGAVNAVASITLPNDASLRLHDRFGFSQMGTSRQIGFKHGKWWDVQWLQLRLQNLNEPLDLKAPVKNFEARL